MVKQLIRLKGISQPFSSLQAKEANLTRLAKFVDFLKKVQK